MSSGADIPARPPTVRESAFTTVILYTPSTQTILTGGWMEVSAHCMWKLPLWECTRDYSDVAQSARTCCRRPRSRRWRGRSRSYPSPRPYEHADSCHAADIAQLVAVAARSGAANVANLTSISRVTDLDCPDLGFFSFVFAPLCILKGWWLGTGSPRYW